MPITIDKAIQRNEEVIKRGTLGNVLETYPALQLGIEALKRLKVLRKWYRGAAKNLLPGETGEYQSKESDTGRCPLGEAGKG